MFKRIEFKMLVIVILLCIAGMISSAFLIDKYIDSYITKLQPQIKNELVVNVYNNTEDKVTVDKDDKGNINVHIDKESKVDKKEPEQGVVLAVSGLNIRTEPNINSDIIDTLDHGTKVKILDETNYWYRIDKGFIYKEYVELIE